VIGSGPLTPPADTGLPKGLPAWLLAGLPDAAVDDAAAHAVSVHVEVVACLDDALSAAAQSLAAAGFTVRWHRVHFDAALETVVTAVVAALRDEPGVVHLWGGEATLVLPPQPGRGGRNQQLALRLAEEIAGARPALVLSAGTDGTDGPTGDAGALVDNLTVERGKTEGLSLRASLESADAGRYLERTGDLLTTGPTGTNVTDLVMAWQAPA
jgi:hydroxypyruvate reductase